MRHEQIFGNEKITSPDVRREVVTKCDRYLRTETRTNYEDQRRENKEIRSSFLSAKCDGNP
ncbi:MAG: hypothetical protein HY473_01755 [Candidatus Sungbacteria bacterium]|uniref:Uncharacterized protein n=1 Tax=Candidatus Sungiibacteriota bacterium TaxID=2750080 RepID=A0A932YWL0_9BACT|nr:hypothetical protein [Candidatus Sungbacteria bacterium]